MATRPWLPTDISSATLEGWYFLRDATGALADGATVTQISGAVSQWNDASGKARHLPQATAANRPTYITDGMSAGRPALAFNPSNSQHLRIASGLGFPSGRVGAFAAMFIQGQFGGNARTVSLSAAAGVDFGDTGAIPLIVQNGQFQYYANGTTPFSAAFVADTPGIASGYADSSSTIVSSLNAIPGAAAASNYQFSADALAIGSQAHSPGAFWRGRMAELVIVVGTQTIGDVQKLEGYLAWNNGTQGSLPANHPYKAAAPTVDDGAGVILRRRPMMLIAS